MKRLAKLSTLLAGALAAALMLSACGGADPADTAAPTVAITDDVTGSTATGAVTFTFTFNEEVKDFTAEDVTVTGGDKASTVTKVSATVYTLVVTPTTNSEGTISVSIAANKLADMANNQNAVVSSVTQGYNTKVSGVALNFEADGLGASFTWSTFENDTQPGVEIVSNPASSGINTSAKVAKFTSLKNGKPYAGFESKHGTDFPAMKLSMSNAVVKIMVYKSVISNVGIKFAAPDGGSTGEIKVPNTKINQWEELTFDFSGVIGGVNDNIDQIILVPDFGVRDQDNVSYVDNITFSVKEASTPSVVSPLIFASGYTAVDAASVSYAYQGKSTEGGNFNWTVADPGSYGWGGSDFWYNKIDGGNATPNFVWVGKGKADQAYMESWVNAPSNTTLKLSGQTKMRIAVWGNPELVGAPRFTPVIQLAESNGCYARAEAAPLTPISAQAADAVHNVSLSTFTVKENCGTAMTITEFMAKPIGSVRVRIYKANYNTSGDAPNGINLGPISFQP